MKLIVALLIVLILGIIYAMWLLMLKSRNEYDDKQSDEDQMKYLKEWNKIHSKR